MSALIAEAFQRHRSALCGYLTRLVARADIAEELVQQVAVRALEQPRLPALPDELRAWLFRVGTNLAIDHLRHHSTWREDVLDRARDRATESEGFLAESQLLAGSPEMQAVAREHVVVCFACTLRNLDPRESAHLLLKEVYGFTVDEVAGMTGATFGQVKNDIQSARERLRRRYDASCALVSQQGACFQCVELDEFFQAGRGDPLAGTARDLDARLEVVRSLRESRLGPWHRQMMKLVDEILAPAEGTH